ncbi:hypothetical protein COV05_00015 [Candidatus Uhrbacteria bacterium CG10_big_fil_rev_8_21_14_0_10_48_16]|uniref:Aminoglycoside phosphotransferase domain-containing protein n=1 Tax=Candidatus Uhrbacteria bacterium CG10_big_fil_rev_8_21_14_0_10_48_16 TaxID=1975038 RepID=A0A2M8LIL2_9BACT|nr:MAG: hypothetical protein COV05_00015 [Candidatus Uhrbacteria bacterium CG10_big_fil_rev_8_21_14_0_10_48_16]
MRDDERDALKESGYCEDGNNPVTCLLCKKREGQEGESTQQEKKVGQAKGLLESIGGTIDVAVRPFKQFDKKRHERFFIQKGELNGRAVVFKVGETASADRLRDESRNMKLLETAQSGLERPLDIYIVRQVGEAFADDAMTGLATEYLKDDPSLKAELSADQKIQVIGRVIDNVQKLPVSDEVLRTSGLDVHDAQKISSDGEYFSSVLEEQGFFNSELAEKLKEVFRSVQTDLQDEQPVFVHGDAHGDNIFLKRGENGNTEVSLLDIEGLRISNRYHDWSEILNKAVFLQHLERTQPDLYAPIEGNVKNMWLDSGVPFEEDAIIQQVTGGDESQARNFRVTRIYDMLTRIMAGRDSTHPLQKVRTELYRDLIKKELE